MKVALHELFTKNFPLPIWGFTTKSSISKDQNFSPELAFSDPQRLEFSSETTILIELFVGWIFLSFPLGFAVSTWNSKSPICIYTQVHLHSPLLKQTNKQANQFFKAHSLQV